MIMQKIKNIIQYYFLGLIAPLLAKPQLLSEIWIFIIAIGVALVIASQPAMKSQEAAASRGTDRSSFWWIYIMSMIALVAPVLDWAYLQEGALGSGWSLTIGLGFLVAGIMLRIWAINTLGRYFTTTVQIVNEHRIVQNGPYAMIRHPSYTGAYLAYVAVGILFEAWVGLFIAMVCMGIAYYQRIKAEEQTLMSQFGLHYLRYANRTKRLIPFVF